MKDERWPNGREKMDEMDRMDEMDQMDRQNFAENNTGLVPDGGNQMGGGGIARVVSPPSGGTTNECGFGPKRPTDGHFPQGKAA